MICQKCKEERKLSTVTPHGSTSTLLCYSPFFDEAGKRHNHDDNCHINSFHCSRGHTFTERKRNTCWCGWQGKEDCFCHPLGVYYFDGQRTLTVQGGNLNA